MTNEHWIAVLAIVAPLVAGGIAAVWKRGNNRVDQVTKVYEDRLADKDKEIERIWQLATELRHESPLDREVVAGLGETIRQLRETVLTTTRGRR